MQPEDAATMRRAAIAGLGVGLLSEVDAREEIALGRLVAPLGFGVMRQMSKETVPGFFLVFPKAHRRVPAVAAFCAWVEKEDIAPYLEKTYDTIKAVMEAFLTLKHQ